MDLNRIIQGNCLELMPALPDRFCDIILTDPDWSQPFAWPRFFKECFRLARREIVIFWSAQPAHQLTISNEQLAKQRLIYSALLIINYSLLIVTGGGASWDGAVRKWEALAWFRRKGTPRQGEWKRHDNVWVFNRVQPGHKADVGHRWQKPEALTLELLRFLTRPGDIVFDPFAGANTTGLVAERLGRRWLGLELEAAWVNRATERTLTARASARGPGERRVPRPVGQGGDD